ncbi:MAG: hypothetical protein K6G52_08340 [Treponemataceae bacterium]|nr:hypothetical protein [Treponemataceae bacterium]
MRKEKKAKKRDFFLPKDEIYDALSFRDQKKLSNLISSDKVFASLFSFFTLVLFVIKDFKLAVFMFPVSIMFIASLFVVRAGKIQIGSLLSTLGTVISCSVIAFFTDRLNTNLVNYRIACFCITMAILNAMSAIKNYQLIIMHVASLILILASQFTIYLGFISEDPSGWISSLVINMNAIVAANLVLYFTNKNNETVVKHSESEHNQIAEQMNKITTVLNETRESLNIGNQLNVTSTKASESVDKINALYKDVLNAAEVLKVQTESAKSSSLTINEQSEIIGNRIQEQTDDLAGTSGMVTELAGNISNINTIAEKRREKMGAVAQTLDEQAGLLKNLVEQVNQVKESSTEIAKFVQTVDSIAGQTNLLAMNASIEAAHAGTMGKGFGVIAQEIRKLSEETAKNAAKISDTLKNNALFVQQAAESVTAFATENQQSAEDIRETITGIEDILHGISGMNASTHDVTMTLQSLVEKANDNSENLKTVVEKINNQNDNLLAISDSTVTLQQCMSALSDMITAINVVIFEMRKSAKQNDEVSSRITQLLDKE